MKMYSLKAPMSQAAHIAQWTFNNGVRIILSYSIDDFFSGYIILYVAVEDDAEKDKVFNAEMGKYITR